MIRAGLAALALLGATVAQAQPVDDLQRDDSAALTWLWRLARASASQCAKTVPQTGIQIEDSAVFDNPALAMRAYGLTGPLFVGALAEDGPGAKAGLSVNTTLASIAGVLVASLPAPDPRHAFDRQHRAQDLIDAAAARDGTVHLVTADGRDLAITAEPVCAATIAIDDGHNYARERAGAIRLGRDHVDETAGHPEWLAAMIAHELAHALLDHQAVIAAAHGRTDTVRKTEHEADRLSVWLLARAGIDPEAAVGFQRGVIARHNGFLSIDATHGGWRERVGIIEYEIQAMHAAPDLEWAKRFRRETYP